MGLGVTPPGNLGSQIPYKGRLGARIEIDGHTSLAFLRSAPTELPDIWVQSGVEAPRRLSRLNDPVLENVKLVEPVERSYEVDGRHIQGWLL